MRAPKGFSKAADTAREFARDPEKTGYLLDEAVQKAERTRTLVAGIWDDLQTLIRLVRTWISGDYGVAPWQTIVFAIAGIVYFVNPFDIVPDFLPGAGYLDDATVVGFVLKSIKKDIEQFLNWERGVTDKGESEGDTGSSR